MFDLHSYMGVNEKALHDIYKISNIVGIYAITEKAYFYSLL